MSHGGGKGSQTTGYTYYMGIQCGLCHGPVDSLVEIRGGDVTLWAGNQTASGTIYINAPTAYGGSKREGGVVGNLDVMMGEPAQGANSYLSAIIGGLQSAYRGVLSCVFRNANGSNSGGMIGQNNPYPKSWSFRIQRALKGWDGGTAWYSSKAKILIQSQGGQVQLNKALLLSLPSGTNITFGGSFTTQVIGNYSQGDVEITVASVSGISGTMSVTDAAGAIPFSTTATLISGDMVAAMNPAHIVYEVLTNRDWGMGYPSSIIDSAAFQAAADELYTEGLGLCLLWSKSDSIQNFLQIVLDHAGAVLIQSRTTGLFQFNLVRGGYNPSTLPVITRDNIIELTSLEASAITGSTNEVTVNWVDPVAKCKATTTVQALGNIQAQGVVVSASKDYPGICSGQLAARIAQRDLSAVSTPLKRFKAKLDRTAFNFVPGGLFVLNFPDLQISSIAFRIGEVDYGTLDQGSILVTAVQDVFGMPTDTYIAPPISGWTPPDATPLPSPFSQPTEGTYRDCYLNLSSYDLSILPSTAGYAGLLAARPTGMAISYEMWTSVSPASYAEHGVDSFCPSATLSASIMPFDTSITLTGMIDTNAVEVPCAAIIEGEIVSVTAFDPVAGTATIARGCVDTVPAAHGAQARIWFSDGFTGTDGVQYFSGEVVRQQPLTVTTQDVLPLGSGPVVNCAISGRQAMPYPPAYLAANGIRWDLLTVFPPGNPFTLTWRERNRITQQDQLIDNTEATLTPETGVTYTVTLVDGTGTPFHIETGITGTSWTWATPDSVHTKVGFQVSAVRAGIASFQHQSTPPLLRAGYGIDHGFFYGGVLSSTGGAGSLPVVITVAPIMFAEIGGLYYAVSVSSGYSLDTLYSSPDLALWTVVGTGVPANFLYGTVAKQISYGNLVITNVSTWNVVTNTETVQTLTNFSGTPSGKSIVLNGYLNKFEVYFGGYFYKFMENNYAPPGGGFNYDSALLYKSSDGYSWTYVCDFPSAFNWNSIHSTLQYGAIPGFFKDQGMVVIGSEVIAFSFDPWAYGLYVYRSSDMINWTSVFSIGPFIGDTFIDGKALEWSLVNISGTWTLFTLVETSAVTALFQKRTTTDGVTWSAPTTCTLPDAMRSYTFPNNGTVTWMDKMSIEKIFYDGTKLVTYTGRNYMSGAPFNPYTSTDGGLTWTKGADVNYGAYGVTPRGIFNGYYLVEISTQGGYKSLIKSSDLINWSAFPS